jgi:hypothetical protein
MCACVKDGPLSETEKQVLMTILNMDACFFRSDLEILFASMLFEHTDRERIKNIVESYYKEYAVATGTKTFPSMDKSDMISKLWEIQDNNGLWMRTADWKLITAMAVAPECFSVPIKTHS